MWRLLPLAVVALALDSAPAGADGTVYGCVNTRTHKIRLIMTVPPRCNAVEMPISWSQVGPKGDPGPPGPKGDPGAAGPGLVLKDSTGAVVGTYFNDHGAAWVIRNVAGQPVLLTIQIPTGPTDPPATPSNELSAAGAAPLYFASSDCSGQPLLGLSDYFTTGLLTGTAPGPGSLVYFLQGPRTLQIVNSQQFPAPGNPCTSLSPTPLYVGIVGSLDLSTVGVPPFHVEAP